ncbi:hypothetical protein ALC62_00778 [Cyphomyrmex costatus]|uniref:Uncharacterized protein n=1 Tax=Cyphomyrmex costatus TaxID=456900 RepID=A0A151IQ12_9HYME|nr:hypothetical protein ALC62_00778 [Cyphomyrmex costatus]
MEKIEASRHKLEKDREHFDQEVSKRELDSEKREHEFDLDNREAVSQPPLNNLLNLSAESRYRESYNIRRLQSLEQSFDNSKIKISFREVTESIPYYDGYNIPLSRFIRACRRAKEIVPSNAERELTKLIINKLGNRAYYAVEDEPCESISDLIDLLTGAFGSPKTVDQYRGELSTTFFKPHEHVLDYISRVKDLRTAILDMERREKRYLDPYFVSQIDDLTTRSFIDGLPFEYRIQMSSEARMSHTSAFAAAKTSSKRRDVNNSRQFDTPPAYQRTPYNNYPANTTRRSDDQQLNSSPPIVRPRDNNNRNAYQDTRNVRDSYRDTRNTQQQAVTKQCRYCKKIGHDISECRRREFNNKFQREGQGNFQRPSGSRDVAPMDDSKNTRPMKTISVGEKITDNTNTE